MRLGTVVQKDRQIVVSASDGGLVDLSAASGFHGRMDVITGGTAALADAGRAIAGGPIIPDGTVICRAPVISAHLRDCLAFEAHLLNAFARAR